MQFLLLRLNKKNLFKIIILFITLCYYLLNSFSSLANSHFKSGYTANETKEVKSQFELNCELPVTVITKNIGKFEAKDWNTALLSIDLGDDPDNSLGVDLRFSQNNSFLYTDSSVRFPDTQKWGFKNLYTGKFIRAIDFTDEFWVEKRGFVAGENVKASFKFTCSNNSLNTDVNLILNAKGIPTILLSFDDALSGAYFESDYMAEKGLKGTIYLTWGRLDKNNKKYGSPSFLNIKQLKTLKSLGWDIQLDGSPNSQSMTKGFYASPQDAIEELNKGRFFLKINDLNPYAEHICYPNGDYRNISKPLVRTDAVGPLGSKILTMNSTIKINEGDKVIGWGISKNTRVLSINSETQLTLDKPLNIDIETGVAHKITFKNDNDPFYTGKLQRALMDEGFKSARLASNGGYQNTRYGLGDNQTMYMQAINGAKGALTDEKSFIRVINYIDEVIEKGVTGGVYFHNISDSAINHTDVNRAYFRKIIDYLSEKKALGVLDVLTVDEWYKRDCINSKKKL